MKVGHVHWKSGLKRESEVRHTLMEDEGKYAPSDEEALFMQASCPAFLYYKKQISRPHQSPSRADAGAAGTAGGAGR